MADLITETLQHGFVLGPLTEHELQKWHLLVGAEAGWCVGFHE